MFPYDIDFEATCMAEQLGRATRPVEPRLPSVDIIITDPRVEAWGGIKRAREGDAAVDLYACCDGTKWLNQNPVMIDTGIKIWIKDPNFVGILAPRSSSSKIHLAFGNTIGVIDSGYQGPLMISARSYDEVNGTEINPGDRIGQLLILPIARPLFNVVSSFEQTTDRAESGFGSTGK